VLCTPGQHEFNGRGPFTFDWSLFTTPDESGEGFSGYETTKYGTSSVYGTQEIANMKTWGWNMLGPYAGSTFQGYLFDIPYIAFGNIAYYARTNSGGYTTNCAVKELMYLLGQSGNITRWGGYSSSNGLTDFADPCWQTYHLAFLNNDPAFGVRSATTAQKGYLVAISDCDSDNCHGFNAGPDFTVKNGNNDYKIGYATLFMAPTLYANSQQSQVYSSGTVYQKKLMHDALVAKYGTIGALNTSWGSSYTTFDSSGVCVGAHIPITCSSTFPADSLGTGDGTTLTFSTTLSHVPTVDDFSVAVYVAGTLVGGETGTGNIYGTNLQASTVNKTTGAITVTFTGGHAPANGAALTVEYVQNGYRVGTGFMDEDCRSGHSSYCGSGSNSVTINLTGIPSNVQSDINAQGTAIANAYSSAGKASIASWATAHGFTGHILYCGPTLAGSWGGPPDKYVLAGYAGNVDCLMQGGSGQGFTHYTQAMNDYIQSQMGDIPQFETSYRTANADSEFAWNNLACTHSGSSVTCTINGTNNFSANAGKHHIDSTCSPSDYNASNVNFSAGANTVTYTAAGASSSSATCNVFYEDSNEGGFATQGARGNDLYSDVTSQINATYTATGTKFVIGYIHWGEQSNQSERLNWGVLTTRGNPLNGVDPTSTTQACSINTGFNCGGELSNHPVPYGDYIGPIGLANTALDNALLVP